MAIPVKLPVFEGPLDLLLHLIEKNKIDIYDIPIAGITDQYLEYVRQMDHEDLDVTSEFLVMAATLLDIKSRMLLPREKDDETGEEEGDPREELVRRLLEYKMYKYLSEELAVYREQAGVRYFRAQKLPREVLDYRPPINYDELLKDTDLQSLQKIFGEVLRRKKSRRDPIRGGFGKIRREEISLDNKTLYIRAYLQAHPRTDFRALLESRESREEVIVTFLILLELMKTQKVHIVQDSIGGKILVEAGAPEEAVTWPEDAPVSMDTPEDRSDVAEDDSASLDTQEDNDDVAEDVPTSMGIPEDSSDVAEALSPAAFESFESLETFEGAGSELRDAGGKTNDSPLEAYGDLETSERTDCESQGSASEPEDSPLEAYEDLETSERTGCESQGSASDLSSGKSVSTDEFSPAAEIREDSVPGACAGTDVSPVDMPLTAFHRMEIVASVYPPEASFARSNHEDSSQEGDPSPASESRSPAIEDTEAVLTEQAGPDPVEKHFSAHLWYKDPCCRTRYFRVYSGKADTGKTRPPRQWMHARMTRLWARRFF